MKLVASYSVLKGQGGRGVWKGGPGTAPGIRHNEPDAPPAGQGTCPRAPPKHDGPEKGEVAYVGEGRRPSFPFGNLAADHSLGHHVRN